MTVSQPPFNASNSIIVRLKIDNNVGMLATVNRVISKWEVLLVLLIWSVRKTVFLLGTLVFLQTIRITVTKLLNELKIPLVWNL